MSADLSVLSQKRLIILSSLFFSQSEVFAASKEAEADAMADGFSRMSLADLPPLSKDVATKGGVVPAGTRISSLLTPKSMGWHKLTLNQIQQYSGVDIGSLPVSKFPGLRQYLSVQSRKHTKPDFWATIQPWLLIQPAIAQTLPPVDSVVPINSIPGIGNVSVETITGVLDTGIISDLGVSQIPEVPNLAEKIGIPTLDKIPGMEYLPLGLSALTAKDWIIPMDVVYGGGENYGSPCAIYKKCKEDVTLTNTASGNAENTSIPCKKEDFEDGVDPDCAHIEVRRRGGASAQKNIRWVNHLQKVEGSGANFLCYKEPTGRYPFGANPKVALEEVNERTDEGTFALYFYIEFEVAGEDLKSAACFGPIPLPVWGTRKAGDLIFFGPDQVSGDSPLSSIVSGIQNPGYGSAGGGECGTNTNPADTKYGYPKQTAANQSNLVTVGQGQYLDKSAAASFQKMVDAAAAQGVNIVPVSGYRSTADQQILWNQQVARQGSEEAAAKISAPPGYSEHETGTTLDLGDGTSGLNQGFASTNTYRWLKANAAKYGFKQSYDGTAGIGAGNEPWHWKYSSTNRSNPSNPLSASSSCDSTGSYSGKLANGFVVPTSGSITSEFGWRIHPIYGTRKFHAGTDYGAEYGTPIRSTNNGVVVSAGWAGGYGNYTAMDINPKF
jgi:murein DD-endopeptidase MepM/ murein hydrolase activator NlpD